MKAATAQRIEVVLEAQELQRRIFLATYDFAFRDDRVGQALMNGLYSVAPDLYEIISGTENDCFYDNAKVSATLAELGFDEGIFRRIIR